MDTSHVHSVRCLKSLAPLHHKSAITSGGGGFLRNGGNVNQRFPGKKYVFGAQNLGMKKSASAQQLGNVNESRISQPNSLLGSEINFLENAGRHRSSVDDIDAENK